MGMYWLDLLAWQQITDVAAGPLGAPGVLRLCKQDPARTYLSVSVVIQNGDFVFLTTNPNPNINTAGIPLMSQYPNFGAPSGSEPPAAGIDLRGVQWHATPDGAGGFDLAYSPGTIAPILDIGALLVYVPGRVEFFVEKHGALAQAAWYTYDPAGTAVYHVLSVRQDDSPCNRPPLSGATRLAQPQTVSWAPQVTNQENENGAGQSRPAAGKQSLLVPNWNGIGEDTGA